MESPSVPPTRPGLIRRALTGTAGGLVPFLMAFPIIAISSCGSRGEAGASGYQLLVGFEVPSAALGWTGDPTLIRFAPDLWILLVLGASVGCLAVASVVGTRGVLANLASALSGAIGLFGAGQALSPSPADQYGLLEYPTNWWFGAELCFLGAATVDLGWMTGHGIRRAWRWAGSTGHIPAFRVVAVAVVALIAVLTITAAEALRGPNQAQTAPPITLAQLRARPLTIPTSGCPLTPALGGTGGQTMYGSIVFAAWTPADLRSGSFNGRIYTVESDEPAIIRGRLIGVDAPMLFAGPGSPTDLPAISRTDASGRSEDFRQEFDFTWTGNTVSATVWVDRPGCYGYQYDNAAGSRVVVVRAT